MSKKKKIKIPKSVLDLRMSPKKFAKKHDIKLKGKRMGKKEKKHNIKKLNREYSEYAINGMNKAVKILAENPNDESKKIRKVKDGVDNIISRPDVMKRVAKLYKKNPDSFQNMIYLPFMIMNTLVYYSNESLSEEEKEIGKSLDKEALIEFCEKILKKQIKRYKKSGLDDAVAYQMATTIPTAKLLKNNRQWYRTLIQQMYDMAAQTPISVKEIIKAVNSVDKHKVIDKKDFREDFYSEFIMKKTSNKNLSWNDSQKDLNDEMIESCLKYLDGLKPRKLRDVLKQYIRRRKTAENYKNDGKRVIKFIDYANSNSQYTTIKNVVTELISDNSSNELYLS